MKKLLSIAVLSLVINSIFAQGFLRRQSTSIINDDGAVLLKGLNLGNWLVEEGFMMGTQEDNYQSPSQWRTAVKDLVVTDENTDSVINAFRNNYITSLDIDSIKAKGFNHVRLPFHYNEFFDEGTQSLKPEGFQYIDSAVAWCSANELYVIIDMHCAPGAQSEEHHADSDGNAYLWSNYVPNRDKTTLIWKYIADYYKDEEWIGGYDLINEPVIEDSGDEWMLGDLYRACIDTIRTVDNNHILFLEGNWFGSDLWAIFNDAAPDPTDRWDENMAYSIHNYWTVIPNPDISNQVWVAQQIDIPLWLGETGENSNTWYHNQVKDLESRNIGWSLWSHKKVASISSPYSVLRSGDYNDILDYWSDGGTKPGQTFSLNAFLDMADRSRISECQERKDIVDAVLRSDFASNSKAYTSLTIPGIIYGKEYDMGANGVAYSDNEYQTISQSPFTAWNKSWEFRNDGVDLEYVWGSDNDYSVSHIATGEWINYTVNVDAASTYKVLVNVASGTSTGQFHIEVDGVDVTGTQSVLNSGGWQSWQIMAITGIDLTAGSHTLKFVIDQSGFNFHRMSWVSTVTAIDDLKREQLVSVYPNPVNDHLFLKQIGEKSTLKYVVLRDVLGRICLEFNVFNSSEINELDVSVLNSGVYFLETHFLDHILTKKIQISR